MGYKVRQLVHVHPARVGDRDMQLLIRPFRIPRQTRIFGHRIRLLPAPAFGHIVRLSLTTHGWCSRRGTDRTDLHDNAVWNCPSLLAP